jgi:DMATS type aromatic prenyltransferase
MKSSAYRDIALRSQLERSEAPNVPGCSYDEISGWQLRALCTALDVPHLAEENLELQRSLFEPWGSQRVPASPNYPSCIADDHSPYEYSVAFSGQTAELRILFEAQAKAANPAAIQAAALETNLRLQRRFGLDLSRFDSVSDLFIRQEPAPPFSLWHAVCLNAGRAPEFKLYLNPQVEGRDQASSLITEALGRLGFSRSAQEMFKAVARRGAHLDEVRYFSLDLSSRRDARVKIYFAHHGVTARELERAFSYAPTHAKGDVEDYLQAVAGTNGPFNAKPITTCFAFVAGQDTPSAATLHYPVAHYAYDDESIAQRVSKFLNASGMGSSTYRRVLDALARRPLDDGAGLQSYASYRREGRNLRLTVYLSPELFRGETAYSGTRIAS